LYISSTGGSGYNVNIAVALIVALIPSLAIHTANIFETGQAVIS
jgi:hypothetical protein